MRKPPNGPLRSYSPEKLERVLLASREAFEIVSFDVFDTLLCRRVASPAVVLERICGASLPSLNQLGWQGDATDLLRMRRRVVRKQCREADSRGFDPETRLDEILAELYECCGGASRYSDDNRRWVREAFERELEHEAATLAPIPPMLRLFHRLREKGRRVVVTSDMYLPASAIRRLLEAHGYDLTDVSVHVSSECLLSKGTGRLFRHWMRLENVEPPEAAHVGDHHWADVTMPDRLGMTSFWLRDRRRPAPPLLTRCRRFVRNRITAWGRGLSLPIAPTAQRPLHGPLQRPDPADRDRLDVHSGGGEEPADIELVGESMR